jgi:hypothetical protein
MQVTQSYMDSPCCFILVIGFMPYGSSWLRSYEVMELEAPNMGYEASSWLQFN